jgi:hypothetical protein
MKKQDFVRSCVVMEEAAIANIDLAFFSFLFYPSPVPALQE